MNEMPLEISNFFLAMQAGPHGLDMLATMFAEDATYSEPFSGQTEPHKGRKAIISAFDASRSDAFDDAVINLSAVDVQGETVTVQWTCISQAIPGGRGSGTNVFQLKDGLITSLVTTLDL
ncbi:nuclear transport factor 2 family protein [Ruegeria atlantica]|uniref:nuclear transport factor 2 family protein n=1 Tax=Ruegeria atlantica TaxID=81569 RepID=UPI00147A2599|nr:nuclear transport factor 2 family protein [Ruegeria atlantica]